MVDPADLADRLHPGPVQDLTAARLRLELVRTDDAAVAAALREIEASVGAACDSLREIVRDIGHPKTE